MISQTDFLLFWQEQIQSQYVTLFFIFYHAKGTKLKCLIFLTHPDSNLITCIVWNIRNSRLITITNPGKNPIMEIGNSCKYTWSSLLARFHSERHQTYQLSVFGQRSTRITLCKEIGSEISFFEINSWNVLLYKLLCKIGQMYKSFLHSHYWNIDCNFYYPLRQL